METEDFDGLVKIHAKECSPDKVGFHFSIQNTFPQKKTKKVYALLSHSSKCNVTNVFRVLIFRRLISRALNNNTLAEITAKCQKWGKYWSSCSGERAVTSLLLIRKMCSFLFHSSRKQKNTKINP